MRCQPAGEQVGHDPWSARVPLFNRLLVPVRGEIEFRAHRLICGEAAGRPKCRTIAQRRDCLLCRRLVSAERQKPGVQAGGDDIPRRQCVGLSTSADASAKRPRAAR